MANAISAPAPSEDEKTMALLAHILQIFTWWIGPLVIFLLKRDSKFVRFHAMQALIWQIAVSVIIMFGVILWLILIFATLVPFASAPASNQAPPIAFFLLIPVFWLGMMGISLLNIILGIVYAVKASRGEWSSYPVVGQWARRIVES